MPLIITTNTYDMVQMYSFHRTLTLMLIVDPLISNYKLPPMPFSDDPPDAILNPPAISEPDVERPRRSPTYAYVPPM